jgi:capsular exopolysaccharide synthesis family protein
LPQYELNIRDYLRIFRKRRLSILFTFIIVTLASVFYVSTQPVVYQASTTVKIEERKTIAGLLTEWIVYNPADVMESQTKIIRGYPVMKKAALRLKLIDGNASLEETNSAVNRIQGNIETERVGQTNMIRIIATTNNPKESMDLANAVAEVYIEENLLEKTKQFRHARQFIEEQLSALETRLKTTEERLRGFQDEVKNIKLAEPIEKKLVDLEFELAELMQKYTEKHPRVIQVREQIKEMEKELKGFSGAELEYARLNREAEVNKKLYAMLKEKLEEARITEAQKVGDVSVVDPAVKPGAPVSTNKNTGIIVGAMMGLVLGVAFAFIFETLDTSIGTIEDVENTIKLPVLGLVPSVDYEFKSKQGILLKLKERIFPTPKTDAEERFIHLVCHYKPKALVTEAFRNIRTNLKLDGSKKTILVTSSNPREGKSTIVTNLGVVTAQARARVVLVSADLRRPSLTRTFGIKKEPGLTEFLTGAVDLDQALKSITDIMLGEMQFDEIMSQSPGLENVWILPAGRLPSNPAEILGLKKTAELIEELKRRFDVVIFDSPPVLPVTDASLLAPKMDAVIIVYEVGRTSREALLRSKIQLESVGAKIVGVILNNTKPQAEAASGYPYYYHYKYGYYGKDESKEDPEKGHQA